MNIFLSIIIILFSFSVFSKEADFSTSIKAISDGPNLSTPCIKTTEPKEQQYILFGSRNDLFAFPITTLRNKRIYLIDMGETHGLQLELGLPTPNDHQVVLSYDTRLFTELISFYQPGGYYSDPISRSQTFTNETMLNVSYNNLNSKDSLLYSIGLGILHYDSKENKNQLLASVQQQLVHNNLDSLIDIQTIPTSNNIQGPHLVALGHLEKKFKPLESITISPYTSIRLASNILVSNITTGTKITKGFNLTKNLTSSLSFDLPLTIYKSGQSDSLLTFVNPKATTTLKYKSFEIGYSIEQPYGSFHRNIPQNKPLTLTDKSGWKAKDRGEMGTIYLKIFN